MTKGSAIFLFVLAFLPVAATGQEAPMAVSPARAADPTMPAAVPDQIRNLAPAAALSLGSLSSVEARRERRGQLEQAGVRRSVSRAALGRLSATRLADGRRATSFSITSLGAVRLRLHFSNFDVGVGEVWVYAPGAERTYGPYTGKGALASGEFWAAAVEGSTAIVTYIGDNEAGLPFTVDAVSHQWTGIAAGSSSNTLASCHVDVSCYPQHSAAASAVVQYDYIDGAGSAWHCSGAMVSTKNGSLIPYLLTAHHCIASDADAQTIQAHFLYQTSTCNGTPPSISSVPTVLGGRYLAGGSVPEGDYALVQLNALPGDVSLLGWSVDLAANAQVMGIHHPQGSYKRISLGTRTTDIEVDTGADGKLPANLGYAITWAVGAVEQGSSGSPLIDTNGKIVGTLVAQTGTACQADGMGIYGRFSNAYQAIKPYLDETPPPPLRADPARLSFSYTSGGPAPAQQTVTLTTPSTTSVGYTLKADKTWLTVSGSGNVSATIQSAFNVSVDTTALTDPGTYQAVISVLATSAQPVSIPVLVRVLPPSVPVSLSVRPGLDPSCTADIRSVVYKQAPDADGYQWPYKVCLVETAGTGSTLTNVKVDGTSYTPTTFFGSGGATLGSGATLSSTRRAKDVQTPWQRRFEISGTENGSGRAWTAVLSVPFLGTAPVITAVANAAGYQVGSPSGSYVSIYGSNLAPAIDNWNKSIYNGYLPTQVDGVSVTIGGKAAYIYFISSGQINVVAPEMPEGEVEVLVSNAGVTSAGFTTTFQRYSPAFFPWTAGSTTYAVATHLDWTYAVKNGAFAGVTTVASKPDEWVVLWATGFGPAGAPSGAMTPSDKTYSSAPVTVNIGGTNAEVYGGAAALASNYAGLYQIAVKIPSSLADGDYKIRATIGGVQSPDNVYLTVKR